MAPRKSSRTSIFYSHFATLGPDLRVEDATSRGRIDMTLRG